MPDDDDDDVIIIRHKNAVLHVPPDDPLYAAILEKLTQPTPPEQDEPEGE